MMDYRAAGFPQNDLNVLKAYSTYAKNAGDLARETGMSEDFGIRIAQNINNTAGAQSDLLVLALLSTTPQAAWGAFERTYGKDIVGQMEESLKHTRTGYAYIDQASEPVKLLAMASAIAMFDEFRQKNDQMDQQLLGLQNGMMDPNALESLLPVIQGMLPDTNVYGQLARSLADKTSCPALEHLFAEKLEEFKQAQAEQQDKLAQLGIIVSGPGIGPMGAPAEVRYPSFEETGLLDDEKVRAAYEVITTNPRVLPEDFEGALATAKLLSDLPLSKNPTTVAAALVDVGIRDLNADDFTFLEKKLDWDVLDLARNFSVHSPVSLQMAAQAPVEFQQIVVAKLTAQLDHVREGVNDVLSKLENPPMGLPMDMELPPELRRMMELQAVQQMQGMSVQAQRIARPLFGNIDAPELEAAFTEKVQALQEFIATHTPKEPKMLPPPRTDFPGRKKPGNDLSFD